MWKDFKARKFPEVEALLAKRQFQQAAGALSGIDAQLRSSYQRALPPAFRIRNSSG